MKTKWRGQILNLIQNDVNRAALGPISAVGFRSILCSLLYLINTYIPGVQRMPL